MVGFYRNSGRPKRKYWGTSTPVIYEDGITYVGSWKNGRRHGNGTGPARAGKSAPDAKLYVAVPI